MRLLLALWLSGCATLIIAAETVTQDVADSSAALEARLAQVRSLEGDFAQELFGDDGKLLEQSSGRFRLLKPGFFSWHIFQPDEQLLVAAGPSLWHYDVELETATRRDIPAGNPTSPLTILGGDSAELAQHYLVQALGEQSWQLRPRSADAEYSAIAIVFDGELPARMEIEDVLQRRTVIHFSAVQADTALQPADFDFQPPPGVDVYDNER
ncbi:MAG: outer membrane lipoprotein chaperone LolA [Halieaceae bacterium]